MDTWNACMCVCVYVCMYVCIGRRPISERGTFGLARVYPKVSGLAVLSENYKWYSSLPLGAVVSLFCESVE
jgi:hypothetical protein